MAIVRIETKDDKALQLIEQLEAMNLVRILREEKQGPEKKLSARMMGSISEEEAEKMRTALEKMRAEWERDIWLIPM